MVEVALDRSYVFQGKIYGPGVCEVPQALAQRLGLLPAPDPPPIDPPADEPKPTRKRGKNAQQEETASE